MEDPVVIVLHQLVDSILTGCSEGKGVRSSWHVQRVRRVVLMVRVSFFIQIFFLLKERTPKLSSKVNGRCRMSFLTLFRGWFCDHCLISCRHTKPSVWLWVLIVQTCHRCSPNQPAAGAPPAPAWVAGAAVAPFFSRVSDWNGWLTNNTLEHTLEPWSLIAAGQPSQLCNKWLSFFISLLFVY